LSSFADSADARQLKQSIDWHLANVADDAALAQRLEGMAAGQGFGALTWYWGPKLYQRNRAKFRPFIQQHFSDVAVLGERRVARTEPVEWAGAQARALDDWLAAVDSADDVALFRRLYAWKHGRKIGWGLDTKVWSRDVAERFVAADTPARRARVLEKFDMSADLQEADALRLYQAAPAVAAPFILKHLPHRGWRDNADGRWQGLMTAARSRADTDLAFKLYRRQVPLKEWHREVVALAQSGMPAAELLVALEQRHPEQMWSDLGPIFVDLLEARGADVLLYVQKHLHGTWARTLGRDSTKALVRLAKARGWVDFRIAVLVKCATPDGYNTGLKETLLDTSLEEPERLRRLALFSGVSREWNFLGWGLASVQQLEPAVALALYERYPALVHTQFKAHVTPAWGDDYFALFERAWAVGDEDLADHLASRYLTRGMWHADAKQLAPAERVADLLVGLKLEPGAFARRACAILTRVPAYAIHSYASLVRNNRLARLLFERSMKDYLGDPDGAAVRDLVEGSEIHVQRLAYRVLALPDSRARALARDNLDVLIGTLLRPLHRDTRAQAFGALKNAAHEAEGATRVLARAREAFALPDQRYPKEGLMDLVAAILARHPQLAEASEARVIYRKVA